MTSESPLDLLTTTASAWNSWREENPELQIEYRGADLHRANLAGMNLSGVDLEGARLGKARLSNTDFTAANLTRANCRRAIMRGANFSGATLKNADFSMADMRKARFDGADLSLADLRGAKLGQARLCAARLTRANLLGCSLYRANLYGSVLSETLFADTLLNEVEGLDHCEHLGPSIIDYRTLQRSGKLPVSFLRGCGLPNKLIDNLPSLLNPATQYHSCFISYSSADQQFAELLYARLQNSDVRCWFAREDMKIGAKILDTLDEAIRLRDKLLLILSRSALESEWVEDEVSKAFAEERDRKRIVVFPIRIDDAVLDTDKPWAVKLRNNRNIGDFSNWNSDGAFQQSFGRLLRDLELNSVT